MKKIPLLLLLITVTISSSSAATLNKNLKVGSKGEDVKVLQRILVEGGYLPDESYVTGNYGKLTARAVSVLQSKHGVNSVGYVGPQTLKVINNLNNGKIITSSKSSQSENNLANKSSNNTGDMSENVSKTQKYKEVISENKDTKNNFVKPSFATSSNGKTRIIVRYKNTPTKESEDRIISSNGKKKKSFGLIPIIATEVVDTDIDKISSDPNVLSIEKDERVSIRSTGEYANTWGVSAVGSELANDSGFTGKGVRVAIFDTGIDYNHQDLAYNYAGGFNFITNSFNPYDDNGHGTHVAGTIVALNNGSGVVGVAPNAKVYSLKVLDAEGGGYASDIIQALEWSVNNGIQVINLSFGTINYPGTALEDAFIKAEAKGIVIVASAGNDGDCGDNTDTVNYPAKFASVISVGAVDKNNQHACFSSSGAKLDLSAPGVSINSTKLGGGNTVYSGTSMASPHVTGAAAVLVGSGVKDQNGNGKINDEVRDVLKKTAFDLGTVGFDSTYGFGLVRVDKALNYLQFLKSTTTLIVATSTVTTELAEIKETKTATTTNSTPKTIWPEKYLPDQASDRAKLEQELKRMKQEAIEAEKRETEKAEFLRIEKERKDEELRRRLDSTNYNSVNTSSGVINNNSNNSKKENNSTNRR